MTTSSATGDMSATENQRSTSDVAAVADVALSGGQTAALFDDVESHLSRFVVYPSEDARVAHVLWIAHTWFMESWDSTPRLAFLSPEPGSGKSRALEVTEALVPRPALQVNNTPAYLYRKVSDDGGAPTILYDEIDTVFGPKAKGNSEEIRGFINAGHRKGATAGRCKVVNGVTTLEELPAYCAVAMAGLGGRRGDLPDTIMTRAVVIRMRRRAKGERVQPWRSRINGPEGKALGDRIAGWARLAAPLIEYPDLPAGVEDRNADVWEPLVAVAQLAGDRWLQRARDAALAFVTESRDEAPSNGVQLLRDLRQVFEGKERMLSEELVLELSQIPESPWRNLHYDGKPINARDLADMLKPYGVKSTNIRKGGKIQKGYYANDLADPWTRYVSTDRSATSATAATREVRTSQPVAEDLDVAATPHVRSCRTESCSNPVEYDRLCRECLTLSDRPVSPVGSSKGISPRVDIME